MPLQIIFCVETNKRAGTDWVYISDTIRHFYNIDNSIRITPVYMETKTNYKQNWVKKEIEKNIKDFAHGNTEVVYCIDVDDFESNETHIREFNDIKAYCELCNYRMVWFCHDVEDVYLGKPINKKEKTACAAAFRRKKSIERVKKTNLSSANSHKVNTSNILNVINDIFISNDMDETVKE